MIVPAMGAQLLTQKYGRDAERESDEYGMLYMSEAGYDPQGAIELQQTFLELAEGRNQDWLSGLFASHPPSRERLENNRETASGLPAGGELGEERFAAKTAYLRRVRPAYEAFDEANKAASDKDLDLAQRKLNEAMAIEPRESLFQALQGDIHALNQKPGRALVSYRKAIDSNPGFFYAYAHYLLGMLDKDAGNMNEAVAHFKAAAQSQSESGQQANRELVVMDLSRNPSRYIASRAVIDNTNAVWVQFGNQTSVPIMNIEISYAWLDGQGQTRQGKKSYRGPLGSGQQDQIKLGISLDNPDELSRRVRVEVSAASIAEQ
jgi:tetratricopeptide (TPR) repeat protein